MSMKTRQERVLYININTNKFNAALLSTNVIAINPALTSAHVPEITKGDIIQQHTDTQSV